MVRRLLVLGLVFGLIAVAVVAGLFWYYGGDLPDIRTLDDYAPKQVTYVYSADGELIDLWVDRDVIYRTVVPFAAIPLQMRQAMLAAEDAGFYQHGGLDLAGVVRAAYHNLRTGSLSQGASTITQQVVKNLLLSPERTIRRKVQEALLAFRLEGHLSKDEILAIYLNQIYFGGNRYGVEEAARYYFGVSISDVTLPQAALLAGLAQSPERYNPYRHPQAALDRRRYVLEQMRSHGFIEESAYHEALEAPLELSPNAFPHLGEAPYFTDEVRRQVYSLVGRERALTGGLRIYTTVRLDHQRAAEDAVHAALREYDARHHAFQPVRHLDADETEAFLGQHEVDGGLVEGETYRVVVVGPAGEHRLTVSMGHRQVPLSLEPWSRINPDGRPLDELYPAGSVLEVVATDDCPPDLLDAHPERAPIRLAPSAEAAFVAIDPATRGVVALVGGYDHATSSFNRATQARRQTGSAFKPFIYGAALDARLVTPASIVRDEPTPFRLPGGRIWNPQNSDGQYLGPLPLRTALARSRNVVSVRLLDEVGLDRAQTFARNAGIQATLTDNLTMALGSSEMPPLELVNAYATIASGGQASPPILVTRITDNRGQVIWDNPYRPTPGMDPGVAYLLADLMTSVVEDGTGRRARELGRPAAGKTGTTNDARDAWFLGFVPQLVAGGWVGYDDYRPLGRDEYGGRAALPIWLRYMQTVLADQPVVDFGPPPDGVVERRIDRTTGLLAAPDDADAVTEHFLSGTEPTRYATDAAPSPDAGWWQPTHSDGQAPPHYDDF